MSDSFALAEVVLQVLDRAFRRAEDQSIALRVLHLVEDVHQFLVEKRNGSLGTTEYVFISF